MASNPPPINTDCVNGEDMIPAKNYSMLLRYLHDNTSFSDRLVELTVVDSTTKEGNANVLRCNNVDTAQENNNKSSGS